MSNTTLTIDDLIRDNTHRLLKLTQEITTTKNTYEFEIGETTHATIPQELVDKVMAETTHENDHMVINENKSQYIVFKNTTISRRQVAYFSAHSELAWPPTTFKPQILLQCDVPNCINPSHLICRNHPLLSTDAFGFTEADWIIIKMRLGLPQNFSDLPDSCINYNNNIQGGYAYFAYKYQSFSAHKYALLAFDSSAHENHDKFQVRHLCGNSLCCNPRHLKMGTPFDQAEDRKIHGTEARAAAKLTDDQVQEIFLAKGGTDSAKNIAARYGIGAGAVRDIWNGTSWNHITGLPKKERPKRVRISKKDMVITEEWKTEAKRVVAEQTILEISEDGITHHVNDLTKDKAGYSQLSICGRYFGAHQVACILKYDLNYVPSAKKLMARHICRNRACFRPEHVELGTSQDNAKDKDRDGTNNAIDEKTQELLQQSYGTGTTQERANILGLSSTTIIKYDKKAGREIKKRKLDEETIQKIRDSYGQDSLAKRAKTLGVHRTIIQRYDEKEGRPFVYAIKPPKKVDDEVKQQIVQSRTWNMTRQQRAEKIGIDVTTLDKYDKILP